MRSQNTNAKKDIRFSYGAIDSKKHEWKWDSFKVISDGEKNQGIMKKICSKNEEIRLLLVHLPDGTIHHKISEDRVRIDVSMTFTDGTSNFHDERFSIGSNTIRTNFVPTETLWFQAKNPQIKEFIRDKIKSFTRSGELRIVDPYLSKELLQMLENYLMPSAKVMILCVKFARGTEITDVRTLLGNMSSHTIKIRQLRKSSSPTCDLSKSIGVSTPFHDRYILSNELGISIGTSFNSILKNATFVHTFKYSETILNDFKRWFSGEIVKFEGIDLLSTEFIP